MPDAAPLLFKPVLGALRPANEAATDAVAALTKDALVRVEIRRTRGNVKRNALYWSCLSLALPSLNGRVEGDPLTVDLLHRVLKDRYGLYTVTRLPSGQEVRNYDSISFHKMTEPERVKFIDWSLDAVSTWIGVDVATLRREAA